MAGNDAYHSEIDTRRAGKDTRDCDLGTARRGNSRGTGHLHQSPRWNDPGLDRIVRQTGDVSDGHDEIIRFRRALCPRGVRAKEMPSEPTIESHVIQSLLCDQCWSYLAFFNIFPPPFYYPPRLPHGIFGDDDADNDESGGRKAREKS